MKTTIRLWQSRMLKSALVLAMILASFTLGHRSAVVVHAQQPTTQLNMPKAWGPLVGTMTGVLVFQDRNGTIRLVAADTGVVAEFITRN